MPAPAAGRAATGTWATTIRVRLSVRAPQIAPAPRAAPARTNSVLAAPGRDSGANENRWHIDTGCQRQSAISRVTSLSGHHAHHLARGPNPARGVRSPPLQGKVMNMLFRLPVLAAVVSLLSLPAVASAGVSHLVVPGETLSGIAAANGLSPAQLAGANGLATDAFVIAGRSLTIPARGTAAVASTTAAATPAPLGGYRVRLGDSLSAIAAEHGVSLTQLAAANGLSAGGTLIAGTSLRLPGAGTATQGAGSAPASTATTRSGGG